MRIITTRVLLVSLVIVALQIGVVTALTLSNSAELSAQFVTFEGNLLKSGVSFDGWKPSFTLPSEASHYRDAHKSSYAFRILDAEGKLIAQHNASLLGDTSPWPIRGGAHPPVWQQPLSEEFLHFAGGDHFSVAGHTIHVEVATLGDPAYLRRRSILYEIKANVLEPTLPLILVLLAVVAISIRWSLAPLTRAAAKADALTEPTNAEPFDIAEMPREAASFAGAINRLLERIGQMVGAQKRFNASAAHELRTPLAIMLLELGKISDPRARRVEADVRMMSLTVDRLLALSRVKALDVLPAGRVDLVALAEEVVGYLQTWASVNNHVLSLSVPAGKCMINGDAAGLREALKNLVENGIKHTPPGTRVDIILAAGPGLIVEDNGPGLASDPDELLKPFRQGSTVGHGVGLGLAIVFETVRLHGGRLEVGASKSGGARFAMHLGRQDVAADASGA